MSERISTLCGKHKSWRRNVAFTIRWVVLLELMPAVADLVSTQTDQTIVIIEAEEGLLLERESWGSMVAITFQRITGENCGNARPYNNHDASRCVCRNEYRDWRFVETDAASFDND